MVRDTGRSPQRLANSTKTVPRTGSGCGTRAPPCRSWLEECLSVADNPSVSAVLAGLDEEQRAAVTAPAGPVCILAGAGTGKTRAITHRIAYRVLTGEIQARHVLAVTFTTRAAAQMRSRLADLGVPSVQARTFHAAALRQLRYFAERLLGGRPLPDVVESKARLVSLAAARSGVRTDRTGARDLAGEIEWAKSSLVEPDDYVAAATKAGREPPHDLTTMAEVYAAYERVKRSSGVIDFEDLLRAAVWGIEEHVDVAEQIRAQYRHFVVDEYQDVNPAQQRLLEAWLGGRDDLTVVGDASQTIYSFTGATSAYLVDIARSCRGGSSGTLVRLVRDYRSTPQVVALANQVIRLAAGDGSRLRLELVGQRPAGPEPVIRACDDEPAEAAAVAARCAELIGAGTPAREIAVLFRTNAQSRAYEEALAEAGVPYVVQGAERFFERVEVRQAMAALRAATRTSPDGVALRDAVVGALEAVGWRPDAPPSGGAARERWEALAALVGLADEGGDEGRPRSLAEFNEELTRRAALQHVPTLDGVTLASLHSAKGLEWDAVFVVGLVEGVLPTSYAKTPAAVEEERRLLYVGVTRARHWLVLSYAVSRAPGGRQRRPSRFLPLAESGHASRAGGRRETRDPDGTRRRVVAVSCRVCGATLTDAADRKLGRCSTCPSNIDDELFARLREWRLGMAAAQGVPAYVVFTDATLTALAERRPTATDQLVEIAGIGPRKLAMYGDAVLALVAGARPTDLLPASDPLPASDKNAAQSGLAQSS
jgi:ATP-dependent DNA helicase UvrD/PcrA